jgi:hypothetical protein
MSVAGPPVRRRRKNRADLEGSGRSPRGQEPTRDPAGEHCARGARTARRPKRTGRKWAVSIARRRAMFRPQRSIAAADSAEPCDQRVEAFDLADRVLLILLPAGWLAVVTMLVGACSVAAHGDAGGRAGQASAREKIVEDLECRRLRDGRRPLRRGGSAPCLPARWNGCGDILPEVSPHRISPHERRARRAWTLSTTRRGGSPWRESL